VGLIKVLVIGTIERKAVGHTTQRKRKLKLIDIQKALTL
jgi:hypothetical protein